MLLADPDAPESPLGRTSRGALVGVIVGVLFCAGALVFGLLKPGGNDAWRSGRHPDRQQGHRRPLPVRRRRGCARCATTPRPC
ncbi:type VII secretion protein EccB [Streptomyces sp. L7]